jgi:SAM-dependent methyltransferase
MRAIIHLLSLELFGESRILPDFPIRPAIKGIGLSDWRGYAILLAHKLGYQNTFYHKEPRLDITRVDSAWEARFDFVIASEVFEHVAPPVSAAFANARRLLKPNGVLIFTVPYTLKDGPTLEHFPDLYDYHLIRTGTGFRLHNRTQAGDEQVFDHLVFHGGAGETLEMRVFTLTGLQREFQKAGFTRIQVHREPEFKFGIYWGVDWSLPITARAVGPLPGD